jgi:hypothetical protein
MVTGCAPVFLLGILGVSLGSWFFGTHFAARLTGLILLEGFLLYFGLLNWTAQSNIRFRPQREKTFPGDSSDSGNSTPEDNDQAPFTEEDRAEWYHYLETEGRILWTGAVCMALLIALLILKH